MQLRVRELRVHVTHEFMVDFTSQTKIVCTFTEPDTGRLSSLLDALQVVVLPALAHLIDQVTRVGTRAHSGGHAITVGGHRMRMQGCVREMLVAWV